MTYLSQIELFLDGANYSKEEKATFIFKSRSVCGFLERALVNESFKTKLSRINVKCSNDISEPYSVALKTVPFLEVWINYHIPDILKLNNKELQLHYLKIISMALKVAEDYMAIPYDFCIQVLDDFQKNDYINKWVNLEEEWEQYSCKSLIIAEVTCENFSLTQAIYRDNELLITKEIALTKPREMLFFPYLDGKFSIQSDKYILYKNNKNKLISKFNIETNQFE